MTKRLLLVISVVFAVLFIGSVSFANTAEKITDGIHHASEKAAEGLENAGHAVKNSVTKTTDNIGNAFHDGMNDVDHMSRNTNHRPGVHHTRTHINHHPNYRVTRTNAPYSGAPTNNTARITTWTVLAVVGITLIVLAWYMAARSSHGRGDRDRDIR